MVMQISVGERLRKRKNKQAFTLVEMMVVVVCVSILFVTLTISLSNNVNRAKEVDVVSDFHAYQSAAENVFDKYEEISDASEYAGILNTYLDDSLRLVNHEGAWVSKKINALGNNYAFSYLDDESNEICIATFISGDSELYVKYDGEATFSKTNGLRVDLQ